MATGWAELLDHYSRIASRDQSHRDAVWGKFQQLAESSERAEVLKHIVRAGSILPARERFLLAVSITRMLAPVDWPSEWVEPRIKLVAALDMLLDATDPNEDLPLFALGGSNLTTDLLWMGHTVLYSARDLLRRPCRRDELRTVALLCNKGLAMSLQIHRASTRRIKQGSATQPLVENARQLAVAISMYAAAARELNEVVGAVLFEGLSAPVEEEEP